ncbi:unnamed protein product [Microthlaspi erraticum]|uniref:DUF4283 domain-containing protein n=1 Tax=Microthlaspi erraticum TaxID=1685480 RepID=A0A6D2KK94_9BRAS|nr:unnamed protein product [Microthlaspi erraticum]
MSAEKGDSRVSEAQVHNAHMEDVGEKGRPPGEPPDAPGSWAQKVAGGTTGGMLVPEDVVDDAFVEARLHLEFPDGDDREPVVTIGEEVLTAMNGLWKKCMIVKVLGRGVSISVMSRKLREMWRPKGAMYVLDLPRQFYMIRFELEEEYMAALTGGPWRVFGSYLMTHAWSPDFDPLRSEIETTPVWVRISNLPVNFYHKSILMGIAKGLGKPGTILINGERYFVSYEGLPNICSLCGIYGHLVHSCPKRAQEVGTVVGTQGSPANASEKEMPVMEDGFTQVRRGRRQPIENVSPAVTDRQARELRKGSDTHNILLNNRFGNLEENKSVEQGTQIVFGAGMGHGPLSNRMMQKGRKIGSGKVGDMGRVRKANSGRPTKGLVFGPTSGEHEFPVGGKCPRVETSGGPSERFVVTERPEKQGTDSVNQDRDGVLAESTVDQTMESASAAMAASETLSEASIMRNGA